MKRILLVLVALLCLQASYGQQVELVVDLELVNPTGKLDGDSYFSLKFYNNTDSSVMLLPKRAMGGNYVNGRGAVAKTFFFILGEYA